MNFRPPAPRTWAMEPRNLTVGEQVTLDDLSQWTVKAVAPNFAALTRPVTDADRAEHRDRYDEDDVNFEELQGDVFYTVLDWRNGLRGPCNLIGQGWGDGTYTEAECAAMLADFEAGELEVSHRNWVRLRFYGEVPA